MTDAVQVDGMTMPTHGVAAYVDALAQAHGVRHGRTPLDNWAAAVERVLGDDVDSDATHDLIVTLRQRGAITGPQMIHLTLYHERERRGDQVS